MSHDSLIRTISMCCCSSGGSTTGSSASVFVGFLPPADHEHHLPQMATADDTGESPNAASSVNEPAEVVPGTRSSIDPFLISPHIDNSRDNYRLPCDAAVSAAAAAIRLRQSSDRTIVPVHDRSASTTMFVRQLPSKAQQQQQIISVSTAIDMVAAKEQYWSLCPYGDCAANSTVARAKEQSYDYVEEDMSVIVSTAAEISTVPYDSNANGPRRATADQKVENNMLPPNLPTMLGRNQLRNGGGAVDSMDEPRATLSLSDCMPRPRWCPTQEQVQILESLFNSGTTTPSRDMIVGIAAQLRKYGTIAEANVFYWFQNRKARAKRKRQQLQQQSGDGEDIICGHDPRLRSSPSAASNNIVDGIDINERKSSPPTATKKKKKKMKKESCRVKSTTTTIESVPTTKNVINCSNIETAKNIWHASLSLTPSASASAVPLSAFSRSFQGAGVAAPHEAKGTVGSLCYNNASAPAHYEKLLLPPYQASSWVSMDMMQQHRMAMASGPPCLLQHTASSPVLSAPAGEFDMQQHFAGGGGAAIQGSVHGGMMSVSVGQPAAGVAAAAAGQTVWKTGRGAAGEWAVRERQRRRLMTSGEEMGGGSVVRATSQGLVLISPGAAGYSDGHDVASPADMALRPPFFNDTPPYVISQAPSHATFEEPNYPPSYLTSSSAAAAAPLLPLESEDHPQLWG